MRGDCERSDVEVVSMAMTIMVALRGGGIVRLVRIIRALGYVC